MRDVTLILRRIEQGDEAAVDELFPEVYDELRRLAAMRLAAEPPDHTLGATALVHETSLRLAGELSSWHTRKQFFRAAAESMRRILVDRARTRAAQERGADRRRADLDLDDVAHPPEDERLLALDEALGRLAEESPRKAEVVKLRFFAGCTIEETAGLLAVSTATAARDWAFARAWLQTEMRDDPDPGTEAPA